MYIYYFRIIHIILVISDCDYQTLQYVSCFRLCSQEAGTVKPLFKAVVRTTL